jgi:hypothetical protein
MILSPDCTKSSVNSQNGHGHGFGVLRKLDKKRIWLANDPAFDDNEPVG